MVPVLKSILGGRPDGTSPSDSTSVGTETLFEVLGNRRRRHVIEVLRHRGEQVPLDRLAEEVAARENDTDRADVSATQRKRVYTALQQTHLPKMDRAGVLTFDKADGTVVPSETISEFTVYLDVVPPRRLPVGAVYLGMAGLSAFVALSVWLDLPPVASVPALVWVAVVVVTFGLVAGLQRYRRPPGSRLGREK